MTTDDLVGHLDRSAVIHRAACEDLAEALNEFGDLRATGAMVSDALATRGLLLIPMQFTPGALFRVAYCDRQATDEIGGRA